MLDEEYFCSEFVREYLRKLQKDKATLTGVFEYTYSLPIVWGAVAEYGPPPQDGLVIEMWSTDNKPEEAASFRFWYGKENKNGRTLKGRVVNRDELSRRADVAG